MPNRSYSLAYLSTHRCTTVQAIEIAAQLGCEYVGLRLWPNAPGGPHQDLLDRPDILRETTAAIRDTGIKILDLEIVRIGEQFDPTNWEPLFEAGAALGAKAVLVAGDDHDESRLVDSYAHLCEIIQPYRLTADLEFMPWTAVKNARSAMRVIQRAGTPAAAGILVDALHFGRSHTTLEDIKAIPRELLHYVQICDGEGGTHFTDEQLIHTARCERLLPGEGTIDLIALFQVLPFDLPVSVEVTNLARERDTSTLAWAGMCLAASREVLGD